MKLSCMLAVAVALAGCAPVLGFAGNHVELAAKAAFDGVIADHEIPGLVVGVSHKGQHYFYATGLASRKDKSPVTPDTLFELGSISKVFNVMLAALAEQRGQLALDAPVARYLDRLESVPAGRLTLMDLATHHSGGLPLQVPGSVGDVDALLNWLSAWNPAAPCARSYSNISIGLLGHISAQSFGMSYGQAMQSVLFPALGLNNTWVTVPPDRMPLYAYGYDRKTDAPIRVQPGVLAAEAYGIKSSARDMLKLLDLQISRSSASAEIAAAIERTQAGQMRSSRFTQAMIWESYPWPEDVETMVAGNGDAFLRPQPVVTIAADAVSAGDVILNKTGSTNGFGGYVAVLAQHDLGIVVLANRNYPNEARVRATYRLIESLLKNQPSEHPVVTKAPGSSILLSSMKGVSPP